jgi:hypothetical protein
MKRLFVCLFACSLIVVAVQLAAQKPITTGRSVCVPYDPATLKLSEIGATGTWRLQRDDGAIFELFADREDAEAGLEVAKRHTQICYIGKSNTRPNRQDYVMTYWK